MRTDMDCADICGATARVFSRHTGFEADISRSLLETCATACKSCTDECARHQHGPICAEACHSCELACRDLLAAMR